MLVFVNQKRAWVWQTQLPVDIVQIFDQKVRENSISSSMNRNPTKKILLTGATPIISINGMP